MNILAVRNDRLGEFLLTLPALAWLKRALPEDRLTLVVNPYLAELAGCVSFADEVIPWENKKHSFFEALGFARVLRKKDFKLCLIFNPSREFNIISFLSGIPARAGYNHKWPWLLTRRFEDKKYLGQRHEAECNFDLLKAVGVQAQYSNSLMQGHIRLNAEAVEDNLIALHPYTSDPVKQWPLAHFKELALKLTLGLGKKVIIIGGKEELKYSAVFDNLGESVTNLTAKTSLIELASLLKKCRLLVSGDSGPVHLASAVDTPVVAIFRNDIQGKTSRRWGPLSQKSAVLEAGNLSGILPDEVLLKVKEVLQL